MSKLQDAPSFHRNKNPMLEVLRELLGAEHHQVLEIASGSGQHGPFFTKALPNVIWWPSDLDEAAFHSVNAWREKLAADAVMPPHIVDVTSSSWRRGVSYTDWPENFDFVLSMNMVHIAPYEALTGLIEGALKRLTENGKLVLYGPFKRNGSHTAPSNAAFDQSLRNRDPSWGIREIENVKKRAQKNGFSDLTIIEMPANNFVLVLNR